MDISRRSFIKSAAAQSAVTAATVLFPGISFGGWKRVDSPAGGIEWKKTPCRFCGTGCGLLVGVAGDRAVAVKGDPNCTVNKGLCCIKGYHSIQILYGKDRIKDALVRKNGKLVEVPIQEALDLVAGGALGAALAVWHEYLGNERKTEPRGTQRGSYLGPDFSDDQIEGFLTKVGAKFEKLDMADIPDRVAEIIS